MRFQDYVRQYNFIKPGRNSANTTLCFINESELKTPPPLPSPAPAAILIDTLVKTGAKSTSDPVTQLSRNVIRSAPLPNLRKFLGGIDK